MSSSLSTKSRSVSAVPCDDDDDGDDDAVAAAAAADDDDVGIHLYSAVTPCYCSMY